MWRYEKEDGKAEKTKRGEDEAIAKNRTLKSARERAKSMRVQREKVMARMKKLDRPLGLVDAEV